MQCSIHFLAKKNQFLSYQNQSTDSMGNLKGSRGRCVLAEIKDVARQLKFALGKCDKRMIFKKKNKLKYYEPK